MKKEFYFNGVNVTIEVPDGVTDGKDTKAKFDKIVPHVLRGIGVPANYEGMLVAIQKPKPDYYEPTEWGQNLYQEHLAKYQAFEKAVKACDWPNDLIDNGVLTLTPTRVDAVVTDVDYDDLDEEDNEEVEWYVDEDEEDEVVDADEVDNTDTYIHRSNGRAPIGSVVVDYTEKGEPIYG